MKVQLIVVQGKPEGKVIPLTMPTLRIGRGENCHLRPNSELVSREHAEFAVTPDKVTIRDLGSRNGTLVNGKALTGTYTLKDRDLVQVGPLTFAVSIQGAPVTASPKAAKPGASPDDISHDEIGAWLVADETHPTPERPSGVYGGDTQTFTNYKAGERPAPAEAKPPAAKPADAPPPAAAAPPPPPAARPAPAATPFSFDEVIEQLPEGEGDVVDEMPTESPEEDEAAEEPIEELIDESNPFYVAKKKAEEPAKPAASQDSSDAASEILRKMMERRRGPR
jgi:pSer/pThr/pTyr-binding forkhead associated (FHA) protein